MKYSDFFRDHLPQHIGDIRREFIFYGLEWDLESRHRSTCTTELNTKYERTLVIRDTSTSCKTILPLTNKMGKDKHKDGETAASSETNRDHSRDQEARDAALAQTIAEAVAREVAKAHAHYQAILNEKGAATLQTSLKVSSGSHGFKVMDPFNWTKDKSIYQRWQLWSEKARLTLDAMEGDSEKTKISYFHHWINGEGMRQIKAWKNNKILISQSTYDELENKDKEGKYSSERIESYFTLFELLLAPRSNPLLAVEDMPIPMPRGRRKSYQGCNLFGYEQSTGQR